jgi:hypothetical protein
MHLSYNILKTKIPTLNRKAHRETDFYRISKHHKIEVHNLELDCLGCYVADADGDYIFIDSRISGLLRLEVELHELSHACGEYPCDFLHFRQELHAETFALILLIPKKILFEFIRTPFDEIDQRLIPILKRRKFIFDRFRI